MCIQIETPLTPIETLTILQDIEKKNGRVRFSNSSYSSRPLDIDIIFFNDLILDLPNLQIPHPRYTERLFVLIPLNEILKTNLPIYAIDVNSKFEIEPGFKNAQLCKDALLCVSTFKK